MAQEIFIHKPKEENTKKEPEPLDPDAEYELKFAFPTDVGDHSFKPGDSVGTLKLKFGFTPAYFASVLGSGITATKVKAKAKVKK